jgi:hypothetical protein
VSSLSARIGGAADELGLLLLIRQLSVIANQGVKLV